MPWSQKIKQFLHSVLKAKSKPQLFSELPIERIRRTLLRNQLVNGNEPIANLFIDAGEQVCFQRGAILIEQDDMDDAVYFLLSGETDIFINDRHIDTKQTPDSVGELAAKKAGEPRTAMVAVKSETLVALKVPAETFRLALDQHPTFDENLSNLIDGMGRQKIRQLGEKENKFRISWYLVSACVALVATGLAWFLLDSESLNGDWRHLAAVIIGFLVLVYMLISNPEFIYRNIFRVASLGMLTIVVWGYFAGEFSLDLQSDGKKASFKWLSGSENDLNTHTMSLAAVFCIAVLSGALDLGQSFLKSRK